MNVALQAYLNSMAEHEKKCFIEHIISTQPWRLKEIKNLDLHLGKTPEAKINTNLRRDSRWVVDSVPKTP